MQAIGDYFVAALGALAVVATGTALVAGFLVVLAYIHQARLEHARAAATAPPVAPLPPAAGTLLSDALAAGSAAVGERARGWVRAAVAESAGTPSRVAAEIVALFVFWVIAVVSEFTFTVARIGGIDGDPNAGAGAGSISWATGLVFVASVSTFMGVLLATADRASFIPRARQRFFTWVAGLGLVGVIISSTSLTIASLEASGGVEDDPLLFTFWVSLMILFVGTVICGHVSVAPLALLLMSGLAVGVQGGLRGLSVVVGLRRQAVLARHQRALARYQAAAPRPSALRAGTLTLLGLRLLAGLGTWRARRTGGERPSRLAQVASGADRPAALSLAVVEAEGAVNAAPGIPVAASNGHRSV